MGTFWRPFTLRATPAEPKVSSDRRSGSTKGRVSRQKVPMPGPLLECQRENGAATWSITRRQRSVVGLGDLLGQA
jgi:hypothetical protein